MSGCDEAGQQALRLIDPHRAVLARVIDAQDAADGQR